MTLNRPASRLLLFLLAVWGLLLGGCAQMPTSGPSTGQIREASAAPPAAAIQVVEIDERVARQLASERRAQRFSDVLGESKPGPFSIGLGDSVEVNIWEAPPATLFSGGGIDLRTGLSVSLRTALPEQTVDVDGSIFVPFAGRVRAVGRTPQAIEQEIATRLSGKANHPEVLIRVLRNSSSFVTVVGDVNTNLRMPLTPAGERLLDALAVAGGVRQPISKTTVEVTRGNRFYAMPLESVIRDPMQNVPLFPGDVITASFQPLSFTALGATGKNDEVPFEAQGINLAQALARSGGVIDTRSDAQGVFIFRFERKSALDWPRQPVQATPDGRVPVVYQLNLRNPASFFVMQDFAIHDKDVLYVSNAPTAELQKFLNLVFSVVYPLINVSNFISNHN